jgi:hypothetical protein
VASLGDLVDASKRAIPDSEKEVFEQFKAIQSGDQAAILKALNLDTQPAEETGEPASDEVVALRQELKEVKEAISRQGKTWTEISDLREQAQLRLALKGHADKFPNLAELVEKDPSGAAFIQQNLKKVYEQIAASGQNPDQMTAEHRAQALAYTLKETEQQLTQTLSVFGAGKAPAQGQPPGTDPVTVSDDQKREQEIQGTPPQLVMRDGMLVDSKTGAPVTQTPDGRIVPMVVPSHIPEPAGGGQPLTTQQPGGGKYGADGLAERAKALDASMSGQ